MTPTPSDEPHSPHAHPLAVLGVYVVLALVLVGLTLPLADRLLPESRTVSASGLIAAGPRTVWTLLARVEDYPSWRASVVRVEPLPGEEGPVHSSPGPGPDLRRPPAGWVEVDRAGNRIRWRVIEATPPERLALEVQAGWPPYRGRRVLRLSPEDGVTRVFVGQRGGAGNALFRFARPYFSNPNRDPGRLVAALIERVEER